MALMGFLCMEVCKQTETEYPVNSINEVSPVPIFMFCSTVKYCCVISKRMYRLAGFVQY